MALARIKWFDTGKGYGFLKDDEGGKDLFFHVANVIGNDPLYTDDQVSFEATETAKGRAAIKVQLVRAAGY